MVPSGQRLDLLKNLIALLYTRRFDHSLVDEVAKGACQLLDSQYLSLSLFTGLGGQRPLVISNNPPDYLPVYFSVAKDDFLRNWVVQTHQEFILRRMRGLHEPENRTFTRTVQNARPVSDIIYLPITSGETLIGLWSLARGGPGREAYTDDELQTFRFLVGFLNDAYQRSLRPPAGDEDTAYLDSGGDLVSAGARIRDAFVRFFGTEPLARAGNGRAAEFRAGFRRFLAGPPKVGSDRLILRDGAATCLLVFQVLHPLGTPCLRPGVPVASVRLVGGRPSANCGESLSGVCLDFGLTRREMEVVAGILKGLSNKVIARNLGVDESTVKRHTHNIYEKTAFRSRVELVLGLSNRTGTNNSVKNWEE